MFFDKEHNKKTYEVIHVKKHNLLVRLMETKHHKVKYMNRYGNVYVCQKLCSLYSYRVLRFKFLVDSLLRLMVYMILASPHNSICDHMYLIEDTTTSAVPILFGAALVVIGLGYLIYRYISRKDSLIPPIPANVTLYILFNYYAKLPN
jgi:hypothetical protein